MTREEAITFLTERDVRRWGEEEREAAQAAHAKLSHGRAVNAVWAACVLDGVPAPVSEKEVESLLTPEDHRALSQGG